MMEERLPQGWIEVPLYELAHIIRGVSYAKSVARDYEAENYLPILRATNIQDEHLILDNDLVFIPKDLIQDEQILSLEDIVICMSSGSKHLVGKTAQLMLEWKGSFGAFCGVARFTHVINKRFFGYFFYSSRYKDFIREKSSGININNLRHTDLEGTTLPLAPLSEQHRIVAAIEQQFTRLDNAVASLQSAKARVKQYRASVLKSAVVGELTKEWRAEHPTEETGAQLLARILDKRRARWEEEQLAKMRERGITPKDDKWKQEYKEPQGPDVEQLPEGWCWATVEQICDQIADCLHSTPKFKEKGFLCVDTNCIKPGKILLEKARYVDEDTFVERNRRMKPQNGDVIFSREGALLGIAVKVPEDLDFCLGQRMMAFRLNQSVNAKYYEIVLNSAVFHAHYSSKITGTASPHLNIEDIRGLAIPLASLQEQYSIVLEVERNLSVIDVQEEIIESSLKRAEHERQSILREAFAGRLVPQDPEDEPADMLLERIREERKKREEAEKIAKVNRKGIQMESTKRRRAGKAGLYEMLVEARRPLPPDDLFKRSGLKTDEQPESVEAFYEELYVDVKDALIKETRPDYELVLLEALEPSAEVLAEAETATQPQEAEQSEKTIDAPTLWNI